MACFLPATRLAGAAQLSPAGTVITIENVELKESGGEWISVIRPDKRVDLRNERAFVSFFNNQGRVPTGRYDDFRITYLDSANEKKSLHPVKPLGEALEVKRGSFVNVCFDFGNVGDFQPLQVKKAAVTVDDRTEEVGEFEWS